MGEVTGIQWTDATWSPWRGCTKVSPGCANCYAEKGAKRNEKVLGVWGPQGTRVVNANWNEPLKWNAQAEKSGKRMRVFPSLCDPFEEWGGPMSDHLGNNLSMTQGMNFYRSALFDLIRNTPWITWQVLTKRAENIQKFWPMVDAGEVAPFPGTPGCLGKPIKSLVYEKFLNLHLYVSVEDQSRWDDRIPKLIRMRPFVPVIGVSLEPLLEYIDSFSRTATPHPPQFLDHAIIGGESGPHARPFDAKTAEYLVRHFDIQSVPVFVKQLGSNAIQSGQRIALKHPKGGDPSEWPSVVPHRFEPARERDIA